MSRVKSFSERIGNFISKHRVAAACAFAMFVTATSAMATTGTAVGQQNTDELEGVWQKVTAIIEGTGGKLAALGIILVSVWNREKIGIPYMGLGVASGILLPSLPSIVNSFTFTI